MTQDTPQVPRRRFLAICIQSSLALIALVAVAVGVDYYFPATTAIHSLERSVPGALLGQRLAIRKMEVGGLPHTQR